MKGAGERSQMSKQIGREIHHHCRLSQYEAAGTSCGATCKKAMEATRKCKVEADHQANCAMWLEDKALRECGAKARRLRHSIGQ